MKSKFVVNMNNIKIFLMLFHPSHFSTVLKIIYRDFGNVSYVHFLPCVPSSLIHRFISFINLCHCRQASLELQRKYS